MVFSECEVQFTFNPFISRTCTDKAQLVWRTSLKSHYSAADKARCEANFYSTGFFSLKKINHDLCTDSVV